MGLTHRQGNDYRVGTVCASKAARPVNCGRFVSTQDDGLRRRKIFVERGSETHEAARLALHRRIEKLQRALRCLQIAWLANEVAKPLKREGGDAIAGRRSIVVARLGAMDELLVVVRNKEEAARLAILELIEQDVSQRASPVEVFLAKLRLHCFH